ncbi:MAG: nucleotide sugar dehydrogenase [Isosphaeraceae bacterium]|nr:nucleotide sugar dehydrogenase [Isosphaeraceae bacterium]
MRISIFGLGYVGCVTAGCFARDGHDVLGVDVALSKVKRMDSGLPTVVEPGLDELIAEGHRSSKIRATTDAPAAILATDISIICVGTPSAANGSLDLTAVRQTARTIGEALRNKPERHLVINRSTVPAGTAETFILPALLGRSGRSRDAIGLAVVPEFLREGCAIADYYNPPFVVAGGPEGERGADAGAIEALFGPVVGGRVHWVSYREAEMLKALCNAFHAMKVAFANEVGALCASLSMRGRAVMEQLVADRKLNISPAYLRPGLPFGGSCLPKDLRMILNLAHQSYLDLPLLQGILTSNNTHLARTIEAIKAAGCRRIGLDGLTFKSGTDDLRESPLVLIAEHLIGKGYDLRIYDPDIVTTCLTGANRRYIEEHLPHLSSRLVPTPEDLLEHAEVLVYTREHSAVRALVEDSSRNPLIIDLAGDTPSVFRRIVPREKRAPRRRPAPVALLEMVGAGPQ